MGARLTTAIKIAASANAILQRVEACDQEDQHNDEEWDMRAHMGIEPMLLALSMELALKAWFVFDHDTPEVVKSHNLSKLFAKLKPESQNKLDSAFKHSVTLLHPNLFHADYGLRNGLVQHANAFENWRYSYEVGHLRFENSVFTATLKIVLGEFKKRHHVEQVPSVQCAE